MMQHDGQEMVYADNGQEVALIDDQDEEGDE